MENRIRNLKDIDDTTPQGKLLMMALARLTGRLDTDKTPEEEIEILNDTVDRVYNKKHNHD